VAFPVPIASVLTGATVAQLAYWRRDTASAPALLVPEGKRSGRFLYSWADIVALRSIVYVRSEKSLPRIRRAVDTLRQLEADEWTHLRLNRTHGFDHVEDVGWKGKPDVQLFRDAAAKDFEVILTLDLAQLDSIEECRALRKSGVHHVGIAQGRSAQGIKGVARVISSVLVAMPFVLAELEQASGQRIVELSLLSATKRHATFDPRVDAARFPYWR
jgi:hypothetical protein